MAKDYNFVIKGWFHDVSENLEKVYDYDGNVTGFKLQDGRVVQLVMALEVIDETKEKPVVNYVTSEKDMTNLGLDFLEYDKLEFIEE